MIDKELEDGVIKALLDRFNQQRLPRLLEIQERLNRGEKLNDLDLAHLSQVAANAQEIASLVEQRPEYKPLVARAIGLYKEITSKALENEQKS